MIYRIVTLLLCSIVMIASFYFSYTYLNTGANDVQLVKPAESQKVAVDLFRRHSEQFLEAAVLLIGGLWGVAIVSPDSRLRRKDWPETIMFGFAVALFVTYFLLANHSTEVTLRLLRDVEKLSAREVPDVLNSALISAHANATDACFFGALVCSTLTVTSLSLFRGSK